MRSVFGSCPNREHMKSFLKHQVIEKLWWKENDNSICFLNETCVDKIFEKELPIEKVRIIDIFKKTVPYGYDV